MGKNIFMIVLTIFGGKLIWSKTLLIKKLNMFRNTYKLPSMSYLSSSHQYDIDCYEVHSIYTDSLYSNNKIDKKEEKVINDIINFYTHELIPLPISPENLLMLKNQWNKEFDMKSVPKKNMWKRIGNSFKKIFIGK